VRLLEDHGLNAVGGYAHLDGWTVCVPLAECSAAAAVLAMFGPTP